MIGKNLSILFFANFKIFFFSFGLNCNVIFEHRKNSVYKRYILVVVFEEEKYAKERKNIENGVLCVSVCLIRRNIQKSINHIIQGYICVYFCTTNTKGCQLELTR